MARKQTFCESNKCIFTVLVIVAAIIAVCCVVIFTDKDIRTKRQYETKDLEWWKTSIVYQIYPRSFKDSGDDGIGDLKGITSKLEYLSYLGVGAIWISPFYKSPMRDFGYDVQNYTEIDPMFGTMTDFNNLMKKATKLDIKVILDFVPNHTSNESEWFTLSRKMDSKYRDYYVWTDGIKNPKTGIYEPPNNWISVFGGSAWKFDSEYRQQFYYHAFLDSQPDLNYRNADVLKELKNVLAFWLNKGVMGFRVDAFKFAYEVKNLSLNEALPTLSPGEKSVWTDEQPHKYTTNLPGVYDVIKSWRKLFEQYKDQDGISRFMSTESYGITPEMVKQYYDSGSVPFNFDLITKLNKSCNGVCLRDIIKGALDGLPSDAWPNFVMGNHDRPRIATRMGREMVDLMNMLLLTLPGTPTCYAGDEIGMEDVYYTFDETQDPYGRNYGPQDYTKYSRDPERSPIQWDNSKYAGFSTVKPWLRVNGANEYTINVKTQLESDRNTHLNVFKKLLEIRKLPSFQNPNIEFKVVNKDILSYIRTAEGRAKYLVILNVSTDPNNHSSADLSGLPNLSSQGEVVAMTGTVRLAFGSVIDLTNIPLTRGQGLVVRLHH